MRLDLAALLADPARVADLRPGGEREARGRGGGGFEP